MQEGIEFAHGVVQMLRNAPNVKASAEIWWQPASQSTAFDVLFTKRPVGLQLKVAAVDQKMDISLELRNFLEIVPSNH